MNIGIDIDDTINNLHNILLSQGTKFNKEEKIKFQINPNAWHWNLAFGWDEETANRFLVNNLETACLSATIKEDAKDIINKLHNEGHKIYIITSRSNLYYKDPYDISKKWLDEKCINYDELIVGALDKAKVCKEKNIDIFIDDHVDFCEDVSKTKTNVLMFDSPYNQNETKYKRVYNWNEVYKNIINKK